MKYAKSVQEFLSSYPEWEEALLRLISILRTSGMEETIKWGGPVYTFQGKNLVGIGAFKSYVGLWFYQGVLLKDPYKVLINAQEGTTKALRQWRFNSVHEIDNQKLMSYLLEAIENQKQGKEIKPENKEEFAIPVELNEEFKQNPDLKSKFEQFTPFKQREFVEYINDAKRDATRLSRIDKIIPMVLEGIGLNDKYRK